ncbi:MAG: hypothetical protein P1U87_02160 [Verrucomicrobiales bacterium]|nr:hypothetical protein [Verrucomicrobiales bacterium]
MMLRLLFCACFFLFTATIADGAELTPVGVAKVDITPDGPVHLVNELAPENSAGISQRLHARAIAIGEDPPVVLIGFDGIGVPEAVATRVASQLETSLGIPRAHIAISASHTHWAPHLSGLLPGIFGGTMPKEHTEEITRYTEALVQNLEKAAVEAIKRRLPSQLSWATGAVEFAANRRLEEGGELLVDEEEGVMITSNPGGPVDHSLPILTVHDPEGKLRALHFTYACHNVAITGREFSGFRNRIHGDWVGLTQEMIETRHPDCIALCTIGCGGDQRPVTCGGIEVATKHASEIADEIDSLLGNAGSWHSFSGPAHTNHRIVPLPLEPPPSGETLQEFVTNPKSRSAIARSMVARRLLEGETARDSVPFQVQSWRFENGPAFLFLSGEVCIDYQLRIKRELGENVWPVAYTNSTPCYIVSKRMLAKGGYEAGNSMFYYGWLRSLKPETEEIVMEAVRNTLRQ